MAMSLAAAATQARANKPARLGPQVALLEEPAAAAAAAAAGASVRTCTSDSPNHDNVRAVDGAGCAGSEQGEQDLHTNAARLVSAPASRGPWMERLELRGGAGGARRRPNRE